MNFNESSLADDLNNKFIKENDTGHDYHYYIKRVTPSYKLR